MKHRAILYLFILISSASLFAQKVETEVLVSARQFRIGEQVDVTFFVRYREGMNKSVVKWPTYKDTLTAGIDILRTDSLRTELVDKASVLYEQSQNVVITAWDSGTYVIPSFIINVDGKEYQTEPVKLFVTTVAVDTTKPIKDLKGIIDVPPPPTSNEPSNDYVYWIFLALLIIVIAIVLWKVFNKNAKVIPKVVPVHELPQDKYLERLTELGVDKPWLRGELKPYHTALTDIIRGWIAERYRIAAREMTTPEIIAKLRSIYANDSAIIYCERVLRTADLVKFAKGEPDAEENERCLNYAIEIIRLTVEQERKGGQL